MSVINTTSLLIFSTSQEKCQKEEWDKSDPLWTDHKYGITELNEFIKSDGVNLVSLPFIPRNLLGFKKEKNLAVGQPTKFSF